MRVRLVIAVNCGIDVVRRTAAGDVAIEARVRSDTRERTLVIDARLDRA